MKTCDGDCSKCALSPQGKEWRTPDGLIKEVVLALAGNTGDWHVHKRDHSTLLTHGRVIFETEGEDPQVMSAPDVLYIRAGKVHRMTALENGTRAYCIHHLEPGETTPPLIRKVGE